MFRVSLTFFGCSVFRAIRLSIISYHLEEKHLHSIMVPLLCFLGGVMCFLVFSDRFILRLNDSICYFQLVIALYLRVKELRRTFHIFICETKRKNMHNHPSVSLLSIGISSLIAKPSLQYVYGRILGILLQSSVIIYIVFDFFFFFLFKKLAVSRQ